MSGDIVSARSAMISILVIVFGVSAYCGGFMSGKKDTLLMRERIEICSLTSV